MAVDLELAPQSKRPAGERCCEHVVYPDGADVLTSARRVGPTGKAIGIDMTDEMLDLARRNATDAGLQDIEITETHRVHQHAASATIRARKP